MAYINNTAWGTFLENMKGALRPVFQKMQKTIDMITPDKPSTLGLGVYDGFSVAYRKNTTDELVFNYSFSKDIFFEGVPEYKPAEDHVIIEVGAHIGTFSVFAASKLKRGHVYAVEPSSDSSNYLRINAALNRCDNISVHQLALADQEGVAFLYYDTGTWGHSTVSGFSGTGEAVKATTLAKFMEENRIEKCDFMKFNCEGAEFPIILSTPPEVLGRFGVILILYHSDLWKKNSEADLVAHLEKSGFHCEVRNKAAGRGWIIAVNEHRKEQ